MADGLSDVDRQVVEAITEWRDRFDHGKVRFTQLLRRPKFLPDERFGVEIFSTGVTRRSPGADPDELGEHRGAAAGFLTGGAEGAAWGTSRRAFIANGPKVLHEWPWDDMASVHVLPSWMGVALECPSPDGPEVIVLHSQRSPVAVGSPPDRTKLAISWLKFEAIFAGHGGVLGGWIEGLPGRLAAAHDQAGS